jgi:hypothetical protein
MSAWKSGDVAMVTFTSGQEGLAVYGISDTGRRFDHCWRFGLGAFEWHDSDNITTARPLVVIDPEDREQVERLESDLAERCGWSRLSSDARADALQAALREFATPTPPRPDEPQGLGAVVEDAEGVRWVRTDPAAPAWTQWDAPVRRYTWSYVKAVRVLSAGVA